MRAPDRILELLSREAPLSPQKIAEKLDLRISIVTSILTFLKQYGFVQYRGRGLYELPEDIKKLTATN